MRRYGMRLMWLALFAINCVGVARASSLIPMLIGIVGALASAVLFLTDGRPSDAEYVP